MTDARHMSLAAIISVIAAAWAAAQAGESRLDGLVRARTLSLTPALAEISGLAPASPWSVFAHNDELGVVYEVSLKDGRILRSFQLGAPPLHADLEAMAAGEGRIWLASSDAHLYEAGVAPDGQRTKFTSYATGIGKLCEVEGMARAAPPGDFLFLCKQTIADPGLGRLRIYEWSKQPRAAPKLVVDVPYADLISGKSARNFLPSDLVRDPKTGALFVLSVRGGVLQLGADGKKIDYLPLARRDHPQPEGLAIMPDGTVVVADEGRMTGGRLTTYVRR